MIGEQEIAMMRGSSRSWVLLLLLEGIRTTIKTLFQYSLSILSFNTLFQYSLREYEPPSQSHMTLGGAWGAASCSSCSCSFSCSCSCSCSYTCCYMLLFLLLLLPLLQRGGFPAA